MKFERDGDVLHVSLEGWFDVTSAAELESLLDREMRGADRGIVFDMDQLTFISSLGLRTIMRAAKRLDRNRGRVVLYGLADPVRQVFTAVGFDRFVHIADNREAARAIV